MEPKENVTSEASNNDNVFRNRVSRFFKRSLIYTGIALIIFVVLYFVYANYTYSEGSRTGYLIKTSKKGYVFKTFEGQLNLGGFGTDKSTGLMGNVWNFSIEDEEMYRKIQAFEGEKVTVSYKEINNAMPWQGKGKLIILFLISN